MAHIASPPSQYYFFTSYPKYCFVMSYDVRQNRSSFDRRLTILKNRIGDLSSFKAQQNKYIQEEKSEAAKSETNAHFSEKKGYLMQQQGFMKRSSSFIRLFINQLQKNSTNLSREHRVKSNMLGNMITKLYSIAYPDNNAGPQGINASSVTELLITILTVFSILFLHFISTFQFIFQDFRALSDTSETINGMIYFCIASTALKVVSSFIIMQTVRGKRLKYISEIAKNYVTDLDFYLDILMLISAIFLATLPLQTFSGIFGYVVSIMNVAYIDRLQQSIDIIIINNNIKKQVFALFKLLFANFFIVHLIGTLLLVITLIEAQKNWMDKYGISNQVWWAKYFYSIYWSASIMATVGFGDIVISNIYEGIILTFIILIGCLILSYNIAQVGNIIKNLTQSPTQVRNRLAVLRRLADASHMSEALHNSIGQYIVHASKINSTFEIKERLQLIKMLPSQMKQEFTQQSSKHFCLTLPFFFMLENDTKCLILEKFKIEVLSPNQYITHKKRGLTKIWILRKGTLGLAYRKKGSKLNGIILDTIKIKDQKEDPQLLNTYLLVRGKKLGYDIICQQYSAVFYIQFEDFFRSLQESQKDFQFYHQCRDQAVLKINDWNKKKCEYCPLNHSLFVCPKLHFMPLRSITFMKFQNKKSSNQHRHPFKFLREKMTLAKRSPIKLWKRIFVPIEKALETRVQKNQSLRIKRAFSTDAYQPTQSFQNRSIFQQYFLKYNDKSQDFELDQICDFKFYFHRNNPSNLIEVPLNRDIVPIMIERFRSF